MPRAALVRATTRVAISESPPRSKKLSSTPTRGAASTSANTAATVVSVSVRGGRYSATGVSNRGCGNDFRSTFPAGVSGISSSTTIVAGTMCAGSDSAACASRSDSTTVAPAAGRT
ncbi:hypothetical protein GCM10023094_48830 [Rhodococcus olei]|uniref:Uncharacterized protein n=1 Tax=Rhodococcus olei TaxID=2161675 RepID=A0ABP8PN47_9NOCA